MIKNRGYSIKKCCFCKFLDFFEEYGIIKLYSIISSMKRILTIIFISYINVYTLLFTKWVFAASGNDDLTKPTYILDLRNLSPISWSSSGTISESGTWIIEVLLDKVSALLLFILPVIAAISLIVAGYYYILSSGDSEKATQAKIIIKWNVIAILVALFSFAIISLIASILGGNIVPE